jgi:hypothetical protein
MIIMLSAQMTDIVEPISNQIPRFLFNNLIIIALFLLGIGAGVLILRIIYTIATKKVYKKVDKAAEVDQTKIYDEIILTALDSYDTEYANSELNDKFEGYKKAFIFMLNNISKTYYPDSDYPIFEVSADELLILVDKVADSLCRQLEKFLDDNFFVKNVFKVGVFMHNKGKKNLVSYNWREIKLSTIKTLIESITNKPAEKENKNFFYKVGSSVKAIPGKLLNSFVSAKIRELVIETGMEINKVYARNKIVASIESTPNVLGENE